MRKIILSICLGLMSLGGCVDKEDTPQEPVQSKNIMLAGRFTSKHYGSKNYGSKRTVPTNRGNVYSRNKASQKPYVTKKSVDTRSNPKNTSTFSHYKNHY